MARPAKIGLGKEGWVVNPCNENEDSGGALEMGGWMGQRRDYARPAPVP